MTIRTMLVDDEPLATQGLQLRLEAHDDVEIVATAANGREAIRAIKTHKPDLVFLDIQMPGFDGFSVIQGLMEVEPPLFVFVTAYRRPCAARVRGAGGRLSDEAGGRGPAGGDPRPGPPAPVGKTQRRGSRAAQGSAWPSMRPKRRRISPTQRAEGPAPDRFEKMINIKDQGQIFRVDVDTIERIDAAGDYMCIQTGDNTLILRETMKDLEKRLDPRRFQRVHRSTIVNLDLVRQVKPHTNGECFLVLDSRRAGESRRVVPRRCREVRALNAVRAARRTAPDRTLLLFVMKLLQQHAAAELAVFGASAALPIALPERCVARKALISFSRASSSAGVVTWSKIVTR